MKAKCSHCEGKGILENVKQKYGFPMCPVCLGSGAIDVKEPVQKKKLDIPRPDSSPDNLPKPIPSSDEKCPVCDGTGKFQEIYDCHVCRGSGIISKVGYNRRFSHNDTGKISKLGENEFAIILTDQADKGSRNSSDSVSRGMNINSNLIIFIIVMLFLLMIEFSSSNSNSNNLDATLKRAEEKIDRGNTDSLTDQEKRAVDKIWNNKNN